MAAKNQRELKEKTYRLLRYQPLTFTLQTGRDKNLLVFDEDKKTNRAIRHCPNEKSIFVDEQSDGAIVKPIVFLNGILETKKTETVTQDFLDITPKNGQVFELIDEAADAEDVVDYEETVLDIKMAVRKKSKESGGLEAMRVLVSVLINDAGRASKMSEAQLKNTLYDFIEGKPERFLDNEGNINIFEDPNMIRQATSQQAFSSGVLSLSPNNRKVIWSDNKAVICHIPTGRKHVEFFAEFLESEEGIEVAKELNKR